MHRINYIHRLIASTVLFIVFGLGGLLIGITAYPLLLIYIRNPANRSQHGQYLIHLSFRAFTFAMKTAGIFSIDIKGLDELKQQGLFIVTNHPTLIDVVILLSLVPRADCVVKSQLMSNPFLNGPLKVAGYIVNSSGHQLIQSCVSALEKHHNLLVFPEGTRTKNMHELHFKRGAAKIALYAKKDITPISIQCQPRMLAKGQKWYKIPHIKPHFTFKIGSKILIKDFLDDSKSNNIQSRNLNRYLINYFKEELHIA